MKTKIYISLMMLLAVSLFFACQKDEVKPGEASIISFMIGDVSGIIDESAKTVEVRLPAGSDLSSQSPVIVLSEGATVTPESGATTDFTNPVVYTVKDKSKTVKNEYTVTVTADPVKKIAFVGQAAQNTAASWDALKGSDFDLLDDKTAAEWFASTFNTQAYQITYISFEDVAGSADLSQYHAVWIQYDGGWWGGEVAKFPNNPNHCLLSKTGIGYDVPCNTLATNFINKVKAYYEAGGNLLLGNYAGAMVDEIGAVSSPDYAPNNAWGGLTVNPNDTPGQWMVRWAGDPTSPLFANITIGTDPNILAPAFVMIEANGEKKNRSNQYNLNFGPWAPNGDADPLATRRASFLTKTGCKILMENGGQNEPQMVMWEANGAKGTVIAILGGTYDWYIGSTLTNTDRNMKTLTKNCLNYLADLGLSK